MGTHQDPPRKFPFSPYWKVDSQGWQASSGAGRLWMLAGAAALFFATLLLCISHPHSHAMAQAGGSDEDFWQGTLTVVDKSHSEEDKTQFFQPPGITGGCGVTQRHVSRSHDETTTTYSDFHLLPVAGAETTTWSGTARVNVSRNWYYYDMDSHKVAQCYTAPSTSDEKGYETTTSGSGVGQRAVTFSRYPEPDSRMATCGFDQGNVGEIAKIPEVGRRWDKDGEQAVKQQSSLLAGDARITFDCDLGARSYSGEKRTVMNPSGTDTEVITWSIHHGPFPETEVELVPPKKYDQWLPQAGEDESKLGNFLNVQIVAHKKDDPDADPPKKVKKYKIELEDTSREKGVDLNWPPKDEAKGDFDMKIDKDNPWISVTDGDNAQKAETKEKDLTKFTVTVNSYDWGGYTKLHVIAELEDGSSVVGHVRGHADQDFLLIPKDDNSNHIADYWEHWFDIKNPDAFADDDDTPHGDGSNGDSIALYDEYRGFHIHGQHERLSPEIKDLFVYEANSLGVGVYGATGINTHVIDSAECATEPGPPNQNVVTPNGSHGDVYAIHLMKGTNEDGVVGQTYGGPSVPHDIRMIVIDTNLIAAAYGNQAAAELQSTIAHELSHATNVWHHGEGPPDYDIGDALCRQPDGTVKNFLCSTKPKGAIGKAGQDCFEVAAKGGKYSGNDQCWMRYDMTNFYEDPAGNCEWQHNGKTVHGSKYDTDPPGMTICETKEGTGVNDPKNPHNKAGNATVGECKNKLRLK